MPRIRVLFSTLILALVALALLSSCEDDPLAPWLELPPEFLDTWGSFGLQDGNFYNPAGIAADAAGNIHIVDTQHKRVQVFNPEGEFLRKWSLQHEGLEVDGYPFGLAIAGNGDAYVDLDFYGVHRFSAEGEFLGTLPVRGARFGVAADAAGQVYVLNRRTEEIAPQRHRYFPEVLHFSANGALLDTLALPSYITGETGWAFQSLAVDSNGDLYLAGLQVTPGVAAADVIWKLSPDGEILERPLYYASRREDGRNRLFEGMAVDSQGFVYVSAYGLQLILKIDPEGRVVSSWGDVGPVLLPLTWPLGVYIDPADRIYVADSQHHRIVRYAYPD